MSKLALVVDDEEDIRELVRFRLEKSGYQVALAVNGQMGVEQAHLLLPAIILLDVRMPVMNGLDAARELKSSDKTKHIPIILLTASVREDAVALGYEAGADHYMAKPFSAQELIAQVDLMTGGNN